MSLIPTSILKKPFQWRCTKRFEEVSKNVRVGGKAAEVLSEAEAERNSENYRRAVKKLKRAEELAKRENSHLERKEWYEKVLSDSGVFTRGPDDIRSRLKSVKNSIRNERYEEAERELNRIVEEMRRVRDSAVEEVFDLREEGLSNFVEGNYEEAAENWRETTRKFEIIAGFDRSGIDFGTETDFERGPKEYVDEAYALTDLAELGAEVSSAKVEGMIEMRSETRRTFNQINEETALNSVNVSEWAKTDFSDFRDQVRRIRNECRALRDDVVQEAGSGDIHGSTNTEVSDVSEEPTSSETRDETKKSPHTPVWKDDVTDSASMGDESQTRRKRRSFSKQEGFEESGSGSDRTSSGSKICPECGKKLNESVVICTECGTNTEEKREIKGEKEEESEGDESSEERVVEPDREPSTAEGQNRNEAEFGITETEEESSVTDTADAPHERRDTTSDIHKKDTEAETKIDRNKNCPECGKDIGEDDNFCTSCGTDLEKLSEDIGVTCPECGVSVDEDNNFCISCGTNIERLSEDIDIACPECGRYVKRDNSFCTSCGAMLSSSETSTVSAEDPERE